MLVIRLSGLVHVVALSAALAVPALSGAVAGEAQPANDRLPQAIVNAWAVPGYYTQPMVATNVNPSIAQAWGLPITVEPVPAMAANSSNARE